MHVCKRTRAGCGSPMAHRLSQIRNYRSRHLRGAATVELCVAAPLLLFLLAAGADFARVYFFAQTLTHCAWNGAAFAADPDLAEALPLETVEEVARIGTESFDRPPDVTVNYGTDAAGQRYAEVTVSWDFRPLMRLPGIPLNVPLQRTSRMRLHPEPEEDEESP